MGLLSLQQSRFLRRNKKEDYLNQPIIHYEIFTSLKRLPKENQAIFLFIIFLALLFQIHLG